MTDETNKIDAILINEVQLLLAEKRTSMAAMRTGIAVLAAALGDEFSDRHLKIL